MKYVAMAKAVCLYVFIVVYWALLIVLYSPVQLPVTLIAIWVEKTGEVHWRKWRYNLWIGQDQSLNALLGGQRHYPFVPNWLERRARQPNRIVYGSVAKPRLGTVYRHRQPLPPCD
ncbi:hypothetical protein [Pseudobowmanella zhangzhouensis]|uniref:hypothetical protein n=1 Tax=Pseudobowmanella zhangzhouensis TaxID=1537679 RepID=UPI00366D5BBA